MTSRTANVVTAAGLVSLLVVVTLTAPRWARMLTRPVGGAEEEGPEAASSGAAPWRLRANISTTTNFDSVSVAFRPGGPAWPTCRAD